MNPINDSLVQEGIQLFNEHCTSCHTMELEHIGPDISDLLVRRKPAWVLNFFMNTEEMLASDSVAMQVGQRYDVSCVGSFKKSELQKAEAILEYLRMYQIWLHEINAPGMKTAER